MVSASKLLADLVTFQAAYSISHANLVDIRDAPSSIPIRSTRMRPGRILAYLKKLNPSLKPSDIEHRPDFDIEIYSFNDSMWNRGLAEYLSDPAVGKTYSTESIMAAVKDAAKHSDSSQTEKRGIETLGTPSSSILRRYIPDWAEQGGTDLPAWRRPQGVYAFDVGNPNQVIKVDKMRPKYSCNNRGIFVKLIGELEITTKQFCNVFDERLYKWTTRQNSGPIKEFSRPTIWEVVQKREVKAHVNFMFHFAPGDKRWFPFSILTGIQGFCDLYMTAFTSPHFCPCKQGKEDEDWKTQGAWVGFEIGFERGGASQMFKEYRNRDGWSVWWAADPWAPDHPELESPPDEKYPNHYKYIGIP